ncbi:helix-turn-helix transcriptional regulator [Vibrio vulnificus]
MSFSEIGRAFMTTERIMSLKEISQAVGRSPKTIWRWWAKEKTFPAPMLINGRCLGWPESEFLEWLKENSQRGEV